MSRYNYHDYKAPSKKELPEDINELALDVASRLDPTGAFINFMKDFQNKKLFGDINYIDPKTNRMLASFEFHSGMCKKFKLIKFLGDTFSHSMQTILNDKIDFRKVN